MKGQHTSIQAPAKLGPVTDDRTFDLPRQGGTSKNRAARRPKKKPTFRWTLSLVGVKGLEPSTSRSQTARATNCATPREVIRQTYGFSHRAGLWRSQSLGLLFSLSPCLSTKRTVGKVYENWGIITVFTPVAKYVLLIIAY